MQTKTNRATKEQMANSKRELEEITPLLPVNYKEWVLARLPKASDTVEFRNYLSNVKSGKTHAPQILALLKQVATEYQAALNPSPGTQFSFLPELEGLITKD